MIHLRNKLIFSVYFHYHFTLTSWSSFPFRKLMNRDRLSLRYQLIKEYLPGCWALVYWNSLPFQTYRPLTAEDFFGGGNVMCSSFFIGDSIAIDSNWYCYMLAVPFHFCTLIGTMVSSMERKRFPIEYAQQPERYFFKSTNNVHIYYATLFRVLNLSTKN